MNELFITIIGVFFLGALLYGVALFIKRMSGSEPEVPEVLPYQLKRYIFTNSEFQFFNLLRAKLDHERYDIFPKVRMGDYIETTNDGAERFGSWNRIKSRHVDFVIWDSREGKLAVAIELDGASHNGSRAKEADGFKNEVFKTIGLELVRVRVGSNFASEIEEIHKKLS